MGVTSETGAKVSDHATAHDSYGLAAVYGLRVLPLRFRLRAESRTTLPRFAESTLRGAFGYALRETVCVTRAPSCDPCSYKDVCSYPYLFETPNQGDARHLAGVPRAPVPYRLRAFPIQESRNGAGGESDLRRAASTGDPQESVDSAASDRVVVEAGEVWEFCVDLFGRASEMSSVVIAAVDRMAARGIGASRSEARLIEVDALTESGWTPAMREGVLSASDPTDLGSHVRSSHDGLPSPAASCSVPASGVDSPGGESERVRVDFSTPVRIRHQGELVQEVPFHLLIRTLLRRASSLLAFHEGSELDVDYLQVIDAASRVRVVSSSLGRSDRWRFSSRQRQTMNLHGMIGHVMFQGAGGELRALLPLLHLGEWAGVGKGTSFGLGRMRMSHSVEHG